MLATAILGTWRRLTLSYVLAPTALEIRHGMRRHRIRYEEITRVAHAEDSKAPGSPGLWPGALAGDERLSSGTLARWWGTTRQRVYRVVVQFGDAAVLLTPAKPERFTEALQAEVSAARFGGAGGKLPGRGLLEFVGDADGWFRVLAVLAFALAVLTVGYEVAAAGAASRQSTIAGLALLANTLFGALLLPRAVPAARILMAATLTYQILGALL
jgi:hypothetical protein